MALFYQIGLIILAILFFPRALYQRLRYGKYASSWRQRFGWGLPPTPPSDKKKIWVHAVSVGEMKAVMPLIHQLHNDSTHWIISCVTETGHAEASHSLKVPHTLVYMPADFRGTVRRILHLWRPNAILISETDLWFNFLSEAKGMKIPIALVNGKISERSAKRLRWVPFFTYPLLHTISLFCLQDQQYADRFMRLGVDRSKCTVTGNLKWDIAPPPNEDDDKLREEWGIDPNAFVVVVGSTHHDEEKGILIALKSFVQAHEEVHILIVPRHPERFSSVKSTIAENGSNQVTLVDRMGVLARLYRIADIVILGGSFVPGIGGHNIIEASQCGVPVLFGPYMENQREMVKHVLEAAAGEQCSLERLSEAVEKLYRDKDSCNTMGDAGAKLSMHLRGATERTAQALKEIL